MRWFWIDRFLEFESGRRAKSIKNVTSGEFHLDGYTPGMPTFPPSLIVEGMAQTGGLLVGEHNEYRERVVLAKIAKAKFHFPVRVGDQLTYEAVVQNLQSDGAIVNCVGHVGDQLLAEVQLVFAHLDDRFPAEIFGKHDLVQMLRTFRLYEVATDADGNRLKMPAYLLEAEEAALADREV